MIALASPPDFGNDVEGYETQPVKLDNPLPYEDVPTLIGAVIRAILGVIGSIALVMFVYAGITWLTSGGNRKRIIKAQTTFIWACIGLFAIFASYAVIRFLFDALGAQ